MNTTITMEQVSLRYKKASALDNLNLRLPAPAIYGLIGRNGAGKSSFLSILASFRRPTEGKVTIGGSDPYENEDLMPHVSFSYEKDYTEETESLRGLIKTAAKFRPYFDSEYATYLLGKFNVPEKKALQKLSKGQQSIATVILGLASRTPVTIFDEAYSGMDAPAREMFYEEILNEYERQPRTFILSTHLISEMDHLFDHVIFLHKGRVLLDEPMDTVMEKGVFATGREEYVHTWAAGKTILDEKRFGPAVTSFLLHQPTTEERRYASELGIELSPASLQDIFIHMSKEETTDVH